MLPPTEIDAPVFMETTAKFVGDLSILGFIIAGFLTKITEKATFPMPERE